MNKIPSKCKTCKGLWTKGISDNVHNKWCCKYGKACYKAYNHCKNTGGYDPLPEPPK